MHLVRAIRQGGRQLLCVITLCWTGAVSAADLSWFDGGLLGLPALQALALLRDADSHGLNPQDYGVDALASAIDAVIHRPGTDPEQERLSQAMTAAMERYLNDLHMGRIDPLRLKEAAARIAITPESS
jgi:murein L,D-transpeptidase YcbB/YkuD